MIEAGDLEAMSSTVENTNFGLGIALGKEFSRCTRSCIVAASVGDANPRLTAKAGLPCRVLAAVWIWTVERSQGDRETSHCNGPCER